MEGFSSGMLHLVTGCSLPSVSRPCSGLIFHSQVLNDEYLVSSDTISDVLNDEYHVSSDTISDGVQSFSLT